MKIIALTLILGLSVCVTAVADIGELDSKGGHYNQQTGEYHYHQKVTPPPEQSALSIQTAAIAKATTDAAKDAERDSIWYGAGFFFGIFGVGAAYVLTPTVPAQRLLGKSPEYLIFYTNAYQDALKTKRVEQATAGCITAGVWWHFIISYLLDDYR